MRLTWHGHACFRLVGADGLQIVTDPYDPATSGYRPLDERADIVVRSSPDDDFHCNAHLVPGDPILVEAVELARRDASRVVAGVPFRAIGAWEGKDEPEENAIYRFDVDGVAIGHMGDVGTPLRDDQLEFLTGVDVLLALAGGPPTIPLGALRQAVDALRPAWVVPMHFRTLRLKLTQILWLESFLDAMEGYPVVFEHDDTVTFTAEDLPASTEIRVLAHV